MVHIHVPQNVLWRGFPERNEDATEVSLQQVLSTKKGNFKETKKP